MIIVRQNVFSWLLVGALRYSMAHLSSERTFASSIDFVLMLNRVSMSFPSSGSISFADYDVTWSKTSASGNISQYTQATEVVVSSSATPLLRNASITGTPSSYSNRTPTPFEHSISIVEPSHSHRWWSANITKIRDHCSCGCALKASNISAIPVVTTSANASVSASSGYASVPVANRTSTWLSPTLTPVSMFTSAAMRKTRPINARTVYLLAGVINYLLSADMGP